VRIHYHTDNYWFSGSESTLLVLLAAALDRPSVQVVFTYRAWPEYEKGLRTKLDPRVQSRRLRLPDPANLKIALSRGRSRRTSRLIRGGISLLPVRQGCFIWDVGRMYTELRRSDPDVVHINNGGFPGAISCNATAIAARLAGIPVLYVVNNLAYPYRTPGRVLDFPIDRLVVRSVSVFVTGSVEAGARLRNVLRLDPSRRRVIPNAVVSRPPRASEEDTRRSLGVGPETRIALVVARLEARKGHRFVLQALAQLPTPLDDVVLVLAGDGPERVALEHLAEKLRIPDRVRFLGEHSDPWSLYAVANVVVLPSIGHEDFPIVVLEAMAAGRPVVASRVAGIPDQVVDGVTGRLVAPGDPTALAAAVADVLGRPGQAEHMGAAGRHRYQTHFAAQRVIEEYWQTYATLTSKRAPNARRSPRTT
jgi:glycosyltransferase involved in cell wall biosynthesis